MSSRSYAEFIGNGPLHHEHRECPLEKMKELRQTAEHPWSRGCHRHRVAVGDEINPSSVWFNMPTVCFSPWSCGERRALCSTPRHSPRRCSLRSQSLQQDCGCMADAGKPVPRGDYMLLIYEATVPRGRAVHRVIACQEGVADPRKKIFQIRRISWAEEDASTSKNSPSLMPNSWGVSPR